RRLPLMMCLVVAGLLSIVSPQDTPPQEDLAKKLEELTKRVEALEKERTALMDQIERLERFGVESAEMITRLKKMIRDGGSKPPAPPETPIGGAHARANENGPTSPVHGRVLQVSPAYNFMIVNLGKEDGVKDGWVFEVLRVTKEENNPNPKTELLGKAVFEKFVDSSPRSSQSKLKITEGDPEKMKYGDTVVANRRMEPLEIKEPAAKEAAKPGAKKHRVFGITGDTYMIDAGSQDGLKQSDRVFVYRDKRAIAQLRLDQVGRDFSAGKIIDNTKTAEIAQNDDVLLKDVRTSIVGKVARVETAGDATGAWIEVGQQQGVKATTQFEVRRQGKTVGRLKVKSLSNWFSVCEAVAPLTLEDLRQGDFIESVE
ncbi:MAG TPA: hypothetical protein VFS19_00230, partial [Planctomycetota bacterium]|nr:hypothetical protein [Planctomycetota bacterium]